MADLIKILIFLSGSAVLGFFLGRRSRNSAIAVLESQTAEKQRSLIDAKSKLDRCTAKRASLERELAGLQQGKKEEVKPVETKTTAKKVEAKKPVAAAEKPKAEAPVPPKPTTKKAPKKQTTAASAPSKQDEALKRVKANAERVNFDRIGRATEAEKDDLKKIKGVGPFLEKKLNTLGIYTFAQIASFTDEDKEAVNEAIEFFPGRISRDNWVDQAKTLQQEKT